MSATLIGIFLDAVSKNRKPAQFIRHRAGAWETISPARALEDVESLALGLATLGIRRGDRVAILAETRYEWAIADLAILGLGAVTVPVYTTLTPAQCRFILNDAEVRLAIVSSAGLLEKVRGILPELPALEAIVHIEEMPASNDPRVTSWQALIERGKTARSAKPNAFQDTASGVAPEDLATIIYTSGTTGDPKGAMLTHRNIASNVESCLQVIQLSGDDTSLSFLPLSHIFERMGGLYAMLQGGVTIAYGRGMDLVAADAAEVKPTVLTAVPRFYEKVHARIIEAAADFPPLRRRLFEWGLARCADKARAYFERRPRNTLAMRIADRLVASKIRARFGGRLRFGVSGGAPITREVMEFFFAIGIPVIEGYGLTETSPVICLNRLGHEKPGSVGPPVPGVEVRIGDEGEILTRGPHVMLGYFHNEAATRAAIRDGWFHTGDIGHLDEEGCLHITDRLKDLIVTAGGKKVAPQPLENRLKASRWIGEAALIGDRRPYIVALIVPGFQALEAEARVRGWDTSSMDALLARPEVLALFQAEIDRVNKDLASFERIKRFALVDREWTQETGELTPSLKVRRRVLDQKYANRIERLYAVERAA
jgi:long-chain acyl-CoA synthetase